MVPVGEVSNLEELVEILGCNHRSLPMTYLGLPLGAKFNSKIIWNTVLEKMEKRLGGWKRLYLSKGGKLTLLKSTLSNIPTDFLSLFHIPAGVASRLERIQRDFLWSGLGESKKLHLVKWSQVCTPIQSGGLGVKNLRRFNQALLGKWLWRYGMERDAYWRKVVEAKYGNMWGGWCTKVVKGSYGVSLWKSIRQGWVRFSPFISYLVGTGDSVQFWHHNWCSPLPLKLLYPGLFSIAREGEASVATLMSTSNGALHWDINFLRNIQDWELEPLCSFMDVIYSLQIDGSGVDKLCWNGSKSLGFTVKSYYRCLSPPPSTFPWKSLWKSKVPPRVAFFTWTAVLGKLPTIDNLRRRGMVLVNRCCMCKAAAESDDHLFLHCPLAKDLWDTALSLFGVPWVMPRQVRGLFDCWTRGLIRHQYSLIWKALPHCLMCSDKEEVEAEEAEQSMLGLQSYWDAAYADELTNFREHGHSGEVWFGANVMEVVASWTKSLCIDISRGHLPNHVDDIKSEPVDQGDKYLSAWSVLDIGTGNGLLLQEIAKQGLMYDIDNPSTKFSKEFENKQKRKEECRNQHLGLPRIVLFLVSSSKAKSRLWIMKPTATFSLLDWCYMCKCGGKTVNHLLLHWPIARELWILIFGLFGVSMGYAEECYGYVSLLARFSDLTGTDYSEGAVQLARSLADRDGFPNINFLVDDVLETKLERQFQLVMDKGTLDAIGLHPDGPVKRMMYWDSVSRLVASGGILVITSCNSTKDELVQEVESFNQRRIGMSQEHETPKDEEAGREPPFRYLSHVRSYPTFMFGGSEGSRVATVAFSRS
uniref:Protein-lysine N-methyltransferase FSB_LOCUS52282 n=1 Tax=Fagus sylvatica TaxID=28930 RepID=A0A2N9IJT9_FAGSY